MDFAKYAEHQQERSQYQRWVRYFRDIVRGENLKKQVIKERIMFLDDIKTNEKVHPAIKLKIGKK